MNEAERRAKRNLNPHAEARAAMWIWHDEYEQSGLGSMDFYDQLTAVEKALCKQCVDELRQTQRKDKKP